MQYLSTSPHDCIKERNRTIIRVSIWMKKVCTRKHLHNYAHLACIKTICTHYHAHAYAVILTNVPQSKHTSIPTQVLAYAHPYAHAQSYSTSILHSLFLHIHSYFCFHFNYFIQMATMPRRSCVYLRSECLSRACWCFSHKMHRYCAIFLSFFLSTLLSPSFFLLFSLILIDKY